VSIIGTGIAAVCRSVIISVCIDIPASAQAGRGLVRISWTSIKTVWAAIVVRISVRNATSTLARRNLIRVVAAGVAKVTHAVAIGVCLIGIKIVGTVVDAVLDSVAITVSFRHAATASSRRDLVRIIRALIDVLALASAVGDIEV